MWKIISGFFSWVFSPIINVLNFPVIPAELVDIIAYVIGIMEGGIYLFDFFCPIDAILPAIYMFLSVWTIKHGYDMVMWILRKIPFIGVK